MSTLLPPAHTSMWEPTIEGYCNWALYEKGFSKYKVAEYKKKLRSLANKVSFPFHLDDVRQFLLTLRQRGKSPDYINYWITLFNSFIRWCRLAHLDQEDFSNQLNSMRPKTDRVPDAGNLLSVEEVQKLITDPTNRPQHPSEKYMERIHRIDRKWSLFFALQYKTASRPGEIATLRKKDFVFANHSMTVNGKTGKRTVAIPPDMEEAIKEYLKPLNDSDYLFTADSGPKFGNPISEEMANRIFKNRARYARIERPVHVHMLRHSGITHMLINGAPISVVQAICGHRRLSTTQLYTHILIENQREAMLRYNPLIRKSMQFGDVAKKVKGFIEEMKLYENKNFTVKFQQSADQFAFVLKEKRIQ